MRALICSALVLLLGGVSVSAANWTVNASASSFSPQTLQINVGDTVTWVNQSFSMHTITSSSSPPAWGTIYLWDGESESLRFNSAGTFPYFCQLHPGMTGTITVGPGGGGGGGDPTPPMIWLNSPYWGETFTAPATITVSAEVVPGDGVISGVEFFVDSSPVGTVSAPPYEITLENLAAGEYEIQATVTDDNGLSDTAFPAVIYVTAPFQITLSSPRFNTSGQFEFEFTAVPGSYYSIQVANDPANPVFTEVEMVYAWSESQTYTDQNSSGNFRLYRVVEAY